MNDNAIIKHALKTAATLLAFAFVGTSLLAIIFSITRAPIEASVAEARLALFKQILPESTYDNAVLETTIKIEPNDLLGNKMSTEANIAKLGDNTVGVILEAIAHDGYSGDIKLLIAIRTDGSISGVRVLTHQETPGLGDYIDIMRGDWIKLFDNESFSQTPAKQWQVKKDGGKFDYMVGATITPRAVIKAVSKALLFFEENKPRLLENTTSKAALSTTE